MLQVVWKANQREGVGDLFPPLPPRLNTSKPPSGIETNQALRSNLPPPHSPKYTYTLYTRTHIDFNLPRTSLGLNGRHTTGGSPTWLISDNTVETMQML